MNPLGGKRSRVIYVAGAIVLLVAGITLPVISRSHLAQNKRAAGRPQDVADLARLEGKKR